MTEFSSYMSWGFISCLIIYWCVIFGDTLLNPWVLRSLKLIAPWGCSCRGRVRPMRRALYYLGWSCTQEWWIHTGHSQREKVSESKWTLCQQAGLNQCVSLTPKRIMKNDVFAIKVGAELERRCCSFRDYSVCVLMSTQQKVSSHSDEKSHWHCCLSSALASWLITQRLGAENNSFLLQVEVKEQILDTNVLYKIDFFRVNLRINKSYL